MNTPLHQRLLRWAAWILAGIIAFGALLDAVSNAVSLVSLKVAVVGSVLVVGCWILAELVIRKYSPTWRGVDGYEQRIRRLGVQPRLAVVGVLILLWIPTLIDRVRKPSEPPILTKNGNGATTGTPSDHVLPATGGGSKSESDAAPKGSQPPEVVLIAPEATHIFTWVPGVDRTPRISPAGRSGYPAMELKNLSGQPVVASKIVWSSIGPQSKDLVSDDHFRKYQPTISQGMFAFRRGPSFVVGEKVETPLPYIATDPLPVDIPAAIWNNFALKLIAKVTRPPEASETQHGMSRSTEQVADATVTYRQGNRTYTRAFRIDASVVAVADGALQSGSSVESIPLQARSKDNLRAVLQLSVSSALDTSATTAATQWDEGRMTLGLAPHVVVNRRDFSANDGIQKVSFYGLSVILHVRNTTSKPKQIRQLEVTGDVVADSAMDLMQIFKRDGKSLEELDAEAKKRQPYRSLSWIAFPIGESRVEADGGERFIKFTLLGPENPLGIRAFAEPRADYFGFAAEKVKPRRMTTSPHLLDLIVFGRISDGEPKEWLAPRLRPEVFGGKVQLSVLVDSLRIPIKVTDIGKVGWTLEKQWNTGNPADLFRGLTGSFADRLDDLR